MLALLIMLALFVQWRLVVSERRSLTPLALQYDSVLKSLQDSRSAVETTTALNRRMADTIAGVRSGSALLTELQRLLPETMRYELIAAKGNRLELSGEVQEPMAVEALNTFQLRLDASSFFERDGLALERADGRTGSGSRSLAFSFNGDFAPDAVKATRSRLMELEAIGLLRRLERLQSEGLLP